MQRAPLLFASLALSLTADAAVPPRIPNPQIDYKTYLRVSAEVEETRLQHRLTEEQFAAMAADPGTVVLDARSADKYRLLHLRGAVSLPFTDFTAEELARVIPSKDTRVLIYCNNNFLGDPRAFATKAAPASLNINTYVSLAIYGYRNVYELGPLLDVKTTRLQLERGD
ncbi:MAG: rhodanese-like domain-containing protein [Myxococcota bacterium]